MVLIRLKQICLTSAMNVPIAKHFARKAGAGDEQVRIPANGFSLAGTISKPAGGAAGRAPHRSHQPVSSSVSE